MIGINRELLWYETLKPAWYKAVGLSEKRATKLKKNLHSGTIQPATIDKYLRMLGYKQVRPAIIEPAVYRCPLGYNCSEQVALNDAINSAAWRTLDRNIRINISFKFHRHKPLKESNIEQALAQLGYTKVQPRYIMPAVWEKPSAVSIRAYTKQDLLDSIIMDSTEIVAPERVHLARVLPYSR